MRTKDEIIRVRHELYRPTRLGFAINGTLADLEHRQGGLAIIDVSNPSSLTLTGSCINSAPEKFVTLLSLFTIMGRKLTGFEKCENKLAKHILIQQSVFER